MLINHTLLTMAVVGVLLMIWGLGVCYGTERNKEKMSEEE